MALFVVERTFLARLEAEGIDGKTLAAVNDDVGVQWLFSFLSADKKKTYCLYEAPNPEAILEAARRLNLPVDSIVEVTELRPETVGAFSRIRRTAP